MKHKSKIKVLFCINEAALGGGQFHVLWLCCTISKLFNEYEIHVLINEYGPFTNLLEENNIDFSVIKISRIPTPLQLYELKKWAEKSQFDLIHTHGGIAALWFKLLKIWGYQTPVVYTYHGIHFYYFKNVFKKLFFLMVELSTNNLIEKIILISKREKEIAESLSLINQKNHEICYLGIPTEESDDQNSLRSKFNISKDSIVVGTIGRLHKQKGYNVFLEVAAKLVEKYSNVFVLVIGDGNLRNELLNQREKLKNNDRIIFAGSVVNASYYLNNFDIFLLTSKWEGFPIVLMEAMLNRLPIVASSVGGIPEMIIDHVNGFMNESDDVDGFYNSVKSLIENRELRIQMGKNNFAYALKNFSIEKMTADILGVYKKLL